MLLPEEVVCRPVYKCPYCSEQFSYVDCVETIHCYYCEAEIDVMPIKCSGKFHTVEVIQEALKANGVSVTLNDLKANQVKELIDES